MENKTLKFKTNINCSGCVAAVTSALNDTEGISEWDVDTKNPNKVLTIQASGISQEAIEALIKSKGYTIEPLQK